MKLIPMKRAYKEFSYKTLVIDPSPNGSGIVYYEGQDLKNWWVATNTKKWIKEFPENCFFVNKVVKKDENQRLERTERTLQFVEKLLNKYEDDLDYIGIEDYIWASGDKSGGLYQMAELGGPLRALCSRYAPVRTNDPMSVKLAFTGSGKAEKSDIMNRVLVNVLINPSIRRDWANLPAKIFENVADAVANAFLLHIELRVKDGLITIPELPKEVIRVFNRVTQANPDCLIDKKFIEYGKWSSE